MARMRPCRVCGNQMASSAKACPSCGAKNKKPIFLRPWFIILVIVVVGAIGAGSSNKTSKQTTGTQATGTQTSGTQTAATAAPEAIKISAAELMKAFSDNEVRANSLYKGKHLTVNGTITDISVVLGQTSVTIGTGEMLEFGILCYPASGQDEKIATFNKGEKITVTGKCDGMSLVSVILRQCQFE